jgi:hypothetical protein
MSSASLVDERNGKKREGENRRRGGQ